MSHTNLNSFLNELKNINDNQDYQEKINEISGILKKIIKDNDNLFKLISRRFALDDLLLNLYSNQNNEIFDEIFKDLNNLKSKLEKINSEINENSTDEEILLLITANKFQDIYKYFKDQTINNLKKIFSNNVDQKEYSEEIKFTIARSIDFFLKSKNIENNQNLPKLVNNIDEYLIELALFIEDESNKTQVNNNGSWLRGLNLINLLSAPQEKIIDLKIDLTQTQINFNQEILIDSVKSFKLNQISFNIYIKDSIKILKGLIVEDLNNNEKFKTFFKNYNQSLTFLKNKYNKDDIDKKYLELVMSSINYNILKFINYEGKKNIDELVNNLSKYSEYFNDKDQNNYGPNAICKIASKEFNDIYGYFKDNVVNEFNNIISGIDHNTEKNKNKIEITIARLIDSFVKKKTNNKGFFNGIGDFFKRDSSDSMPELGKDYNKYFLEIANFINKNNIFDLKSIEKELEENKESENNIIQEEIKNIKLYDKNYRASLIEKLNDFNSKDFQKIKEEDINGLNEIILSLFEEIQIKTDHENQDKFNNFKQKFNDICELLKNKDLKDIKNQIFYKSFLISLKRLIESYGIENINKLINELNPDLEKLQENNIDTLSLAPKILEAKYKLCEEFVINELKGIFGNDIKLDDYKKEIEFSKFHLLNKVLIDLNFISSDLSNDFFEKANYNEYYYKSIILVQDKIIQNTIINDNKVQNISNEKYSFEFNKSLQLSLMKLLTEVVNTSNASFSDKNLKISEKIIAFFFKQIKDIKSKDLGDNISDEIINKFKEDYKKLLNFLNDLKDKEKNELFNVLIKKNRNFISNCISFNGSINDAKNLIQGFKCDDYLDEGIYLKENNQIESLFKISSCELKKIYLYFYDFISNHIFNECQRIKQNLEKESFIKDNFQIIQDCAILTICGYLINKLDDTSLKDRLKKILQDHYSNIGEKGDQRLDPIKILRLLSNIIDSESKIKNIINNKIKIDDIPTTIFNKIINNIKDNLDNRINLIDAAQEITKDRGIFDPITNYIDKRVGEVINKIDQTLESVKVDVNKLTEGVQKDVNKLTEGVQEDVNKLTEGAQVDVSDLTKNIADNTKNTLNNASKNIEDLTNNISNSTKGTLSEMTTLANNKLNQINLKDLNEFLKNTNKSSSKLFRIISCGFTTLVILSVPWLLFSLVLKDLDFFKQNQFFSNLTQYVGTNQAWFLIIAVTALVVCCFTIYENAEAIKDFTLNQFHNIKDKFFPSSNLDSAEVDNNFVTPSKTV